MLPIMRKYLEPIPPYTDSFAEFYKYTMTCVFENSRQLEKIIGAAGIAYSLLKISNPRKSNKGTGKIIGSSLKMISISYFSDFVDTLIDCLENEDKDRFLMFAATTMDRELKKYLYDEGLEIRKKYNQLETTAERNKLFSDIYKRYLFSITAAKTATYYDLDL